MPEPDVRNLPGMTITKEDAKAQEKADKEQADKEKPDTAKPDASPKPD